MRILYIVPSLIQAGPVNVAHDLVQVMQNHGHTCDVAYFDDRNDRAHNNFPCETFKINAINWDKYDIIHTHGFRPDLVTRLKMPGRLRKRLVSTLHNLVFIENRIRFGRLRGWIYSQIELWAVKKHSKIITLTEDARNYYKRYFPEEKLNVCCNTRILEQAVPDSEDIKNINDFKLRNKIEHIMGSHCSFTYRKGLEQAIKVLQLRPDIGLVLVGDGPQMKELQDIAKDIRVDNRILWLGRRSKAYRYIPLFDLFIIPSRSEGFPLSLLEAACMGKASVSSDIDVFCSTFPENDILPKFKLDNIEDFATTIDHALANRKELGLRIQDKFNSTYSPEIFYRQHLAVYSTLIANRSK